MDRLAFRSPLPSLALLAGPLLGACSEYEYSKSSDAAGMSDTGWGGGAPSSEDEDEDRDGAADTGEPPAPEEDDDFLKLEPASTRTYVFVANPTRGTVTRVDVETLAVITTGVGSDPVAVATTPDYARAVTFNRGSDDVSIVPSEDLENVTTVEVRANYNTMKMSPDGRFVLCWYDEQADEDLPPEQEEDGGARSYNEVSLVDTVSATHFPMVVGFNPRDVQFARGGTLAVVVSDAYLALIDLTLDIPEPVRIQVSEDLIDPPEAEEVVVAADGSTAFVRQFGMADLAVVDLDTRVVARVPVGAYPSDLDLTPDGLEAVAVAKGSQELWIYQVAAPTDEPRVVALPDAGTFGSIVMNPDNQRGLLYSNTSGESIVASWDRATDDITPYRLVKPIESVGVSPDGETALVFHTKENGDTESSSPFFNEWALTLVDLEDFFSSSLVLPSEPSAFAQSDDGTTGFFIMDGEPYLEVLHYSTLLYDEIALASEPVHVGVLPETDTAWANQEHDLGRLSFYDSVTEDLQTITGFELNAGIEH